MCISFVRYFCVTPFFFFFSFVTRNMAGYIVSISSFVFGAPPRASSFTENYTKQWAVSNFLSLFALNIFRKRTGGGGGFLLLLSSTLVTFCTAELFDFLICFREGGQGWHANEMTKKGEEMLGGWGVFFSVMVGRGLCCGESGGHIQLYIVAIVFYYFFPGKWST